MPNLEIMTFSSNPAPSPSLSGPKAVLVSTQCSGLNPGSHLSVLSFPHSPEPTCCPSGLFSTTFPGSAVLLCVHAARPASSSLARTTEKSPEMVLPASPFGPLEFITYLALKGSFQRYFWNETQIPSYGLQSLHIWPSSDCFSGPLSFHSLSPLLGSRPHPPPFWFSNFTTLVSTLQICTSGSLGRKPSSSRSLDLFLLI